MPVKEETREAEIQLMMAESSELLAHRPAGQAGRGAKAVLTIVAAFLFFATAAGSSAQAGKAAQPDIPGLRRWLDNMVAHGRDNCRRLTDGAAPYESRLADTYYDAVLVYRQIRELTGDASWDVCIAAARSIYRDRYVMRSRGVVPGYWNFTSGLTEDFLATGEVRSRRAVVTLAKNAAFARDSTPLTDTRNARASREVAFAILSYLNQERLTGIRRARLRILVAQALGHLSQWFGTRRTREIQPFMVGLTSYALIRYRERRSDRRILPALVRAADELWENYWLPDARAFVYVGDASDPNGSEPAPDLNLLIAPLYAWLYKQTGERRFLERGDQAFAGGVEQAWLGSGKQFDQNYMISFKYVEWRSASS